MDFNHRILPYYMTYPVPYGVKQEEEILRDMEYLQQMYPGEVKKYQQRVSEILDKVDYEGSMIYDEYPDRYSVERLAKSILKILQQEEAEQKPENPSTPEKWQWVENIIQVLLCDEICKRRHGGRRGFIKF